MTQDKNHQTEEEPWLLRIITLPKYLGEAIFTLIGNNEAPTSSKFILGYLLIAGLILLALAFIAPETLKALIQYLFQ